MFLCALPKRNKKHLRIMSRKRKGEKNNMPTELIKDFLGKVCSIALNGGFSSVKGKIISVENDWIKIEEASDIIFFPSSKNKNTTTRLINSNMISEIEILPEKYQK